MHVAHAHQGGATQPSSQPRTEKLTRPQLKVKDGLVTEEAWEYFNHQWSVHKRQANIQANLKEYLEQCLGDDITHVLFGRLGQTEWDKLTETTLLKQVEDMFLKKRNRMVNRLKLHGMNQDLDQPIQQYMASLKQIARSCKFSVKCKNTD